MTSDYMGTKYYMGNPSSPDENRVSQAEVLGRVLELSGLPDKIHDPEVRLEVFRSLGAEEFTEGIVQMNGILLNIPGSERGIYPDLQVITDENTVAKDVLPLAQDKPVMLSEVLQVAQGMGDLGKAALVLCHGVNAVHPFRDGNGRVSRALYHLLMQGYTVGSEARWFSALGEDGNGTYDLNTGVFSSVVYAYVASGLGTHINVRSGGFDKFLAKTNPQQKEQSLVLSEIAPLHREHSEEELQDIGAAFKTPMVGDILAHLVSKDDRYSGKAGRKSLQRFKKDGLGHKADTFFVDEFVRAATEKDINNFWNAYRTVKRKYVTALLGGLSGGLDEEIGLALRTLERGVMMGSLQEMGLKLARREITPA